MFVTAVLCPHPGAFDAWCHTNGYVAAGDGAERPGGRWMALRIITADDLRGVTVHRVDYALDFWRLDRDGGAARLDALARSCVRRPAADPTRPDVATARRSRPTPR